MSKRILIYFILPVFIVALMTMVKSYVHSDITVYRNMDATMHTLLTAKSYNETPIEDHYFAPLVTLPEEHNLAYKWGATVRSQYSNKFFYTSFPFLGFVVPHLFIKSFQLNYTPQALLFLNAVLLYLTIIFSCILIEYFFKSTKYSCVLIASLSASVFNVESFFSFGFVYWHQSLFQPLWLLSIYIFLKLLDEYSLALNIMLGILMCALMSTEWSAFLVAASYVVVCFSLYLKKKENKHFFIISSIVFGGLVALLLTYVPQIYLLGYEGVFLALKKRFFARNFSSNISWGYLLKGYIESYSFWLVTTMIGIIYLIKEKIDRKYVIIIFVLIFPLMENIIMKEHAITYTFDRLKFAPVILFFTSFLFLHHKKKACILCFISILFFMHGIMQTKRIKKYAYLKSNIIIKEAITRYASNPVLSTNLAVRGYSNLLFDRNIKEWVTEKRYSKFITKNNKYTTVWLSTERGEANFNKILYAVIRNDKACSLIIPQQEGKKIKIKIPFMIEKICSKNFSTSSFTFFNKKNGYSYLEFESLPLLPQKYYVISCVAQ